MLPWCRGWQPFSNLNSAVFVEVALESTAAILNLDPSIFMGGPLSHGGLFDLKVTLYELVICACWMQVARYHPATNWLSVSAGGHILRTYLVR